MQNSDDITRLSTLKQDNNLEDYQYFFMKYYKPLCIKASQMLGNMDMARETVQQLFIDVWKSGAYKDIQHSVGGFFYQLVCRKCEEQLAVNADAAERNPVQCPPCLTGPALVPQALGAPLLIALEH